MGCHSRSKPEGAPCIKRFHSVGQHLCKFVGTKEIAYIRKEFNYHRICLEHQHRRRFIVLEHQYGRRDVTWKRSIELSVVPLKGHWLTLQSFRNNNAMLRYLYGRSGCMSLNLQIGRLGFWNLCDMRRTEKQVVHISLLKTLLLFMECRSRLRDCPRNIDVRVFIWYFKSLRGLQFQFLLWFEAFTEALESFCKISHRAMLKEHVPGFMVFNSLLLKGTYFCLIFWISKDSRTENWDELQK